MGCSAKPLIFRFFARRVLPLAVLALLGLVPGRVCAEPVGGDAALPPMLAPVYVYPEIGITAAGASRLSREVIDHLPRGNGSITEILGILPDVQFGEDVSPSTRGGEILPPDVSISGGKTFENRFSLDGTALDSQLDPVLDDPADLADVPGHPLALFLDASLVNAVMVYDSNVPARYGGFTGGVVDAALRDPGDRFGGSLDYRTTHDKLTRFYLSDEDRYDFSTGTEINFQPKFWKHDAGVSLDLPVRDDLRLLAAYRVLHSSIPLQLLETTVKQSRENHNLLLHGLYEGAGAARLETSFIYAPYQAVHYLPDARDSRYVIDHGGWLLKGAYQRPLDRGDLELRLAFRDTENSRQAPQNWRLWAATDSRDWGRLVGSDYSRQGGFGDLEKTETGLEAAADLRWFLGGPGRAEHDLAAGLGLEIVSGSYRRPEAATVYTEPRTTNVICGADLFACIDGEQFFTLRRIYDPVKLSETIVGGHLYAEDLITSGQLRVRPGLRLSYDDFLDNLDLAPRLLIDYDLFGDDRTHLIAGLNRYYGRSLLAFKLREARRPPRIEFRTTSALLVQDWLPDPQAAFNVARFSDLDTPYTDEATVGIDQALWSGQLSLKYILRQGRDEFARSFGAEQSDGLRYYSITNDGRSDHRILRTAWERTWAKQSLLVSWVYQQSETSNEDYDTVLDEEGSEPRIWYRDQIVYLSELPRRNYNRPHVVKLYYRAELPKGFSFTNTATFLGGYTSFENTHVTREVPPAQRRIDPRTGTVQESLEVYADIERGNELFFNWKVDWRHRISAEQDLTLNLEILNVFDRRIESGVEAGQYRLGRQFWLGLAYSF